MIDDSARKALVDGASNALPSTLEGRVTYLLRRVTEAAGRMASAHLDALSLARAITRSWWSSRLAFVPLSSRRRHWRSSEHWPRWG